ncbi:MAG: hypothetical protein RL387_1380 [Bacteroidota bacterium]|jgi:hypothetical protein
MLIILKDLTILLLLIIAISSHVLKLIVLYFKPYFLKKLKFLENEIPTKTELTLYYILVILACSRTIIFFINHNKFG